MKIVFVKIRDPISWKEPTAIFFEDDKKCLVCNVVRFAGLLVHETKDIIAIGAIQIAGDNPRLDEYGVVFPRFSGLTIIAKESIKDRQEFEVEERN